MRRFFFVHLQKTAGTALWRRLKSQFDERAVYPGPGDGVPPVSVLSVPHLLERWAVRGDEITVVTGHFPLAVAELLGGGFTTLTVLRDPVERTLSFLRHHRETTPEDADRPLEAIYEDPVRFELLHNHMVKMLALGPDEVADGAMTHVDFTAEHLERAEERLAGVDVVGFQERFDEFCNELTARFGWDLGKPIFMNRTSPGDVPASFRRRIAVDNALDVTLYEHALARANR